MESPRERRRPPCGLNVHLGQEDAEPLARGFHGICPRPGGSLSCAELPGVNSNLELTQPDWFLGPFGRDSGGLPALESADTLGMLPPWAPAVAGKSTVPRAPLRRGLSFSCPIGWDRPAQDCSPTSPTCSSRAPCGTGALRMFNTPRWNQVPEEGGRKRCRPHNRMLRTLPRWSHPFLWPIPRTRHCRIVRKLRTGWGIDSPPLSSSCPSRTGRSACT